MTQEVVNKLKSLDERIERVEGLKKARMSAGPRALALAVTTQVRGRCSGCFDMLVLEFWLLKLAVLVYLRVVCVRKYFVRVQFRVF